MDISVALKNLIRDGIVSSTDPSTMTANISGPRRFSVVSTRSTFSWITS